MPFSYTNTKNRTYFLHERKGSNGAQLFFFSKEVKSGVLNSVPDGYEVAETKTGLPVLRKAK